MVTTATVEAFSVAEAVEKVDAIHKAFGGNVDIDLTIRADDKDKEKLGYSFPWLKNNNAQEETAMGRNVGAIEFNIITDMTKLPQKVASAAAAVEYTELVGASYKPLVYVGKQITRGTNYWFIAEETLVTHPPQKKLVTLAVNEFQGTFALVNKSIHEIEFKISDD